MSKPSAPFQQVQKYPARGEAGADDPRSPGAVDKQTGKLIRARRLEIGMSQERLAELLGVTFQQVQKYEKGVNRIAWPRVLDICEALDISPLALVPETRRKKVAGLEVAPRMLTPPTYEAAKMIDQLPKEDRRVLLRMVRNAASAAAAA